MSLKKTDVKTPGDEAIAKKFKLSLEKVRALVKVGADHEKEHNTNLEKAKQVARDHIAERPDYYKMLKKAEKTKVSMKEESGVGGIRGLGYVSGDPAGTNYVQSYINSNAMSYTDENGNKLEYNKKNHNKLHKMTFNDFNPKNIKGNKNFMKEQKLNELGDYVKDGMDPNAYIGTSGPIRAMRKNDIKEVKIPPKIKKAVATGMTLANIATLGSVAGGAAEGRGSPKRDIVAAASGLPGKIGWGATAGHYSIKGLDKAKEYIRGKKQMKEDKDPCWKGYEMVGMKKKGGRKVPNCVPVKESGQVMSRYTERPQYEQEQLPKVGGIERGIYQEDWQSVNRKDKTDGLSQKAVNAYRREHPGSKLKTAVTEKNPSGKRAARRKSFCSRMGGMKKRLTSAKTARDPDSRINKALRRWNCEEQVINELDLGRMARTAADAIAPGSTAAYDAAKSGNYADAASKAAQAGVGFMASRVAPVAAGVLKSTSAAAAEMTPDMENKIRSAKAAGQKVGPVNELKAETLGSYIKKAAKSRKSALEKGGAKADLKTWGKRQKGITTAVKKLTTEETIMDNEHIKEGINSILENDLVSMKESFMAALEEKVMEKLDERKKDIAANYFAQD